MPHEPEPRGLLSLMLLHESRRGVAHRQRRVDHPRAAGPLALGPGADRRGRGDPRPGPGRRRAGPYQLQAAIAASHATAADVDATDWTQIADLYAELARLAPSPVIELNRAVAVAMADGVQAGLALVDELAVSDKLVGYYLLPATRADLLRRDGRAPRRSSRTSKRWSWPRPTPSANTSPTASPSSDRPRSGATPGGIWVGVVDLCARCRSRGSPCIGRMTDRQQEDHTCHPTSTSTPPSSSTTRRRRSSPPSPTCVGGGARTSSATRPSSATSSSSWSRHPVLPLPPHRGRAGAARRLARRGCLSRLHRGTR